MMMSNIVRDSRDRKDLMRRLRIINKVTKNVDPEIVIRYGSAKYFGALQGHPYEDILQLGNRLERNEALNPFDETFFPGSVLQCGL